MTDSTMVEHSFTPCYLRLAESGELRRRVEKANSLLSRCHLCPLGCGVDRLKDETGLCHTGARAVVSSYGPHFGEEPPLVGRHGSGTVFLAWCNLSCVYCQNYETSHQGMGTAVGDRQLAEIMVSLQRRGCHNINFVSPSHVVPQILAGLSHAVEMGLRVPLVYNTGGYDSLLALRLLEGVFDIYMPDMKYADAKVGLELSGIRNYPPINQTAVKEMHRQVGDLLLDKVGIAMRGLIIRHLVLPNGLAGSEGVLGFIAEKLSINSYVNIMDQYRPCYKAGSVADLSRRVSHGEFIAAVNCARQLGLRRVELH